MDDETISPEKACAVFVSAIIVLIFYAAWLIHAWFYWYTTPVGRSDEEIRIQAVEEYKVLLKEWKNDNREQWNIKHKATIDQTFPE